MRPGPTLTPTALRTRYHELRSAKPPAAARVDALPRLAAESDECASDDWVAHVQAGRIAVR